MSVLWAFGCCSTVFCSLSDFFRTNGFETMLPVCPYTCTVSLTCAQFLFDLSSSPTLKQYFYGCRKTSSFVTCMSKKTNKNPLLSFRYQSHWRDTRRLCLLKFILLCLNTLTISFEEIQQPFQINFELRPRIDDEVTFSFTEFSKHNVFLWDFTRI